MSWSVKVSGKPELVDTRISNDTHTPGRIKHVVKDICERLKECQKDLVVTVETSGHLDFPSATNSMPIGYASLSIKYGPPVPPEPAPVAKAAEKPAASPGDSKIHKVEEKP